MNGLDWIRKPGSQPVMRRNVHMGGSGSCRREGRLTDHLEVESESGTIGKHPRRSARAKWREKEDTAEMHQPQ